ncbi:PGF-pre-PGF domain-containing protein [Methanosarcina sp.]|uniref:PGF-pre-PGF domain-containing protein n=1 Tax=Methanosarcina sp. TaxID=2213 RepID=UPI003BB6AF21
MLVIIGMTPSMASAANDTNEGTDTGNSTETDNGTGTGTGTDNGTDTGTGSGTGTDNGTDTGTGSGTGSDNGTGTGTGSGTGTDNGTGTGTGSGTGSDNGTDTGTGSGTGSDNGTDTGTGSGTGSDNGTDTGTGSGTGTDNGTGTGTGSGTGSDNGTDTGTGSGTGTDNGTDTGTGSGTGTETGTGTSNGTSTSTETGKSGGDGSSSSSSIGSDVSVEPASNIDVKELATRHVISGYPVRFDFVENITCVTYIEFDPTQTFKKTTTIVEVLRNKSTLVPILPPGRIYKYVNIWVGNKGAGLPTSLKNGLIEFRVEKAWIEKNNVNESLITLQWYDEGWKPLYTEKVGENENYIYFKAVVPGFSFFAITEYATDEKDKLITQTEGKIQGTLRNLKIEGKAALSGTAEKKNGGIENPMGKAKTLMAISLPLFMILVGYGVLKKKI